MKRKLSILIFLIFPLSLIACQSNEVTVQNANMNKKVEQFAYKDAETQNKSVSLDTLKGEWWIANFMYTNCQAVCPMMTQNILFIQNELESEQIPIEIVSFTVDPEFDSPDILMEHASSYGVDLTNWRFLTGYSFKEIQEFAAKSFEVALQQAEPGTGNDQVAHTTNFFLVNPEGKVVKKYEGVGQTGKDELLADLRLINGK